MHASLRLHALGMRSHLHRRINSRLATLQCSRDLAKPNTVIHVRIEYYVLVVDKISERDCIICILHKQEVEYLKFIEKGKQIFS